MSNMPWLTLLMAVPLVGALVVALLPAGAARLARPLGLIVSLLTLGVGIAATVEYTNQDGRFRLEEKYSWIPDWGVSYALGVDGIALSLIMMALVLLPICLIAAWDDVPEVGRRQQGYIAWMLALTPFMVGVFAATDVFLFYVLFEAMLIPVYFLIGQYGGEHRKAAAVKFLLYSLLGGLVMLVGVIALFAAGPGGSYGMHLEALVGHEWGAGAERLMFLSFFLAFAIKAPMVPVHTWLPDAASQARPATAVLLVGVLDKVGTYGMIRFCLELFPNASAWATPVVVTFAVISVVYAALLAVAQDDMMRLIAFTSVSHFGFIVLGIFALNGLSMTGSALYMVNHGFTTAGLFLVAGMLVARRGSRKISDFGGWQRVTPLVVGALFISGMSGLALPGMNSFVSEFMVLIGSFQEFKVATIIAMLGVILAALYILWMYKRLATGPKPEGLNVPDMSMREKLVAGPLIVIFLVLGFYPKPVLDLIEPSVTTTVEQVSTLVGTPSNDAEGSPR